MGTRVCVFDVIATGVGRIVCLLVVLADFSCARFDLLKLAKQFPHKAEFVFGNSAFSSVNSGHCTVGGKQIKGAKK